MAVLTTVIPIFLLMVLGHVMRKRGFPGEGFWDAAEKLIFFILLPCLFFYTTATADFIFAGLGRVLLILMACLAFITLLMVSFRRRLAADNPSFTSVHQGAVRFNSYIGVAVTHGVYGQAGMAVMALFIGVMVPYVNLLSIIVLSRFGAGNPAIRWRNIIKRIVTNPLVYSSLIGLGWNLAGLPLPGIAGNTLHILGQAALPMGLMAVGAGLRRRAQQQAGRDVCYASLIKMGLFPMMALALGVLCGVSGMALHMLVLFTCLPCASSAYILAKQMGGNAERMASIVIVQTLACMLTLPVILLLMQHFFPIGSP